MSFDYFIALPFHNFIKFAWITIMNCQNITPVTESSEKYMVKVKEVKHTVLQVVNTEAANIK